MATKSFKKKQPDLIEQDDEEDDFSPSGNAYLIRGLGKNIVKNIFRANLAFCIPGKFRKMYKNKRTTDLLKEIEANETTTSHSVGIK